jgi:ankyrin repeat protein
VHAAAREGHLEVLSLLLASGADPNALDDRGASPLAAARRVEQCEAEALLLRAGASDATRHNAFAAPLPQLGGGRRYERRPGGWNDTGAAQAAPQGQPQARQQRRWERTDSASASFADNARAAAAALAATSHAQCWRGTHVAAAAAVGFALGAAVAAAAMARARR